jgi:Beta-galactosidase trimerisation domain/Hypothetical glycosyl hydrolase 6
MSLAPDTEHAWLGESLAMIMTMRADDAARWDVQKLVALAQSFSLGALGFSVGGVTAFYPSQVAGHPLSPSLDGRDLVAETVSALHAAGIRAIGRIDPSLGSAEQLALHPDRFARTLAGEPVRLHDTYLTCPNGEHFGGFMLDVVREIVQRFPLDGLWANAAQFSPWGTGRCFCGNCQRMFTERFGRPFPMTEDWSDPDWKRYSEWRYERIADWNRRVREVIQSVRPACAWLPLSQVIESWDHTRKGGWDVDLTSKHADGVVLEAQRRYCNLWWPGMEARYAHAMDPEHGAGITVSYFYPWWRFTHAPVAENRVWAAQIAVNGAKPWLHITGYFSEYFDRRGLAPMQALFKLFHERADVYGRRRSAAEVALVFSRKSLDYAGGANPDLHYLDGFRGAYNALMDSRIPFDLISDQRLDADKLARYRAVLLPNLACMSDECAAQLERYVDAGGRIVATYRTGFADEWGVERAEPWIAKMTGARYTGRTLPDLKAAYAHIGRRDHPLIAQVGDTDLLPLAGSVCVFEGGKDGDVLRLVPPVEARPGSGMSVPEFNAVGSVSDTPLLLTHRRGRGTVCYFPWEPDRIGFHFGLSDPMRLLTAALRVEHPDDDLVTIEARGLIDVSVMDAVDSRALHIVNFNSASGVRSGHRRAVEDVVPLHDLVVELRLPEGVVCTGVDSVVANAPLAFGQYGTHIRFVVPQVDEFESVVARW